MGKRAGAAPLPAARCVGLCVWVGGELVARAERVEPLYVELPSCHAHAHLHHRPKGQTMREAAVALLRAGESQMDAWEGI